LFIYRSSFYRKVTKISSKRARYIRHTLEKLKQQQQQKSILFHIVLELTVAIISFYVRTSARTHTYIQSGITVYLFECTYIKKINSRDNYIFYGLVRSDKKTSCINTIQRKLMEKKKKVYYKHIENINSSRYFFSIFFFFFFFLSFATGRVISRVVRSVSRPRRLDRPDGFYTRKLFARERTRQSAITRHGRLSLFCPPRFRFGSVASFVRESC